MEFPHDWAVLPMGEFEKATPRIEGDFTFELLAQLRPSGRILDNFRVSIGGNRVLEIDADLRQLIPVPVFRNWRIRGQFWARDVAIRPNVFSSTWIDLPATIAMRQLQVFNEEGAEIDAGEVLRIIEDLDEDGPESASIRYAVVIGEDGKPRLQMQSLPGAAVLLTGKALLKG